MDMQLLSPLGPVISTSFKRTDPEGIDTVPKSMEVSRKAATTATGATVIAHSANP
jgi:hypothetical protein